MCQQSHCVVIVQFTSSVDSTSENVTNLQPFTSYTCCVSASNQAGEGDDGCITAVTLQGDSVHSTLHVDLQGLFWGGVARFIPS